MFTRNDNTVDPEAGSWSSAKCELSFSGLQWSKWGLPKKAWLGNPKGRVLAFTLPCCFKTLHPEHILCCWRYLALLTLRYSNFFQRSFSQFLIASCYLQSKEPDCKRWTGGGGGGGTEWNCSNRNLQKSEWKLSKEHIGEPSTLFGCVSYGRGTWNGAIPFQEEGSAQQAEIPSEGSTTGVRKKQKCPNWEMKDCLLR